MTFLLNCEVNDMENGMSRATSVESQVRLILGCRNREERQRLHASVLYRPVGCDTAIVRILGELFTIDNVRRLVNSGVQVTARERKTTWPKVRTQADVNALFSEYPRLSAKDFAI